MKIISICNQKGGVGKTTTCLNLGAAFAKLGKKVCIIDLDPQGNLSATMGITTAGSPQKAMNDLIYLTIAGLPHPPAEFVVHHAAESVDFIPAAKTLSTAPPLLASDGDGNMVLARIFQDEFWMQYDYILIDCKPALDLLTINALAASHSIIIPVEPEGYAVDGLINLMESIERTRRQLNPALKIEGILITKANSRRNLTKRYCADLEECFPGMVFETAIPLLVEAPDAVDKLRSCVSMSGSRIGQSYMAVAKEVLAHDA